MPPSGVRQADANNAPIYSWKAAAGYPRRASPRRIDVSLLASKRDVAAGQDDVEALTRGPVDPVLRASAVEDAPLVADDERKREHSAGAAAGHFQRHEMLRQQPGCVDDSPAPVEQSCKAVGTATRVHPSLGLRQQAARGEVVSLPGISHLALLLLAPQLPGAHPP
jgi:hypothetical protein